MLEKEGRPTLWAAPHPQTDVHMDCLGQAGKFKQQDAKKQS